MVSSTFLLQAALVATGVSALAMPHGFPRPTVPSEHIEVLKLRASTAINPAAIADAVCIDRNVKIVFHDENRAELLSICDGRPDCAAKPSASSQGQSGSALFKLQAARPGAVISLKRGKWEACVRAARAVCPTGSLRATCLGGASVGDVKFSLGNPSYGDAEL